MWRHRSDRVVIMAKAPRAGHAKTRLAEHLPAETVVVVYKCLLADTVALATSINGVSVAAMVPSADVDEVRAILPSSVTVVPQHGEGLAAALTSTFAFFDEGFRRVIALDTDTPHLAAHVLEAAFDTLDRADLVVGPTTDGGYYLVGMKAKHAGLFDHERLGTASALAALSARAHERALTLVTLDECYDIDEHADLVRLARDLAGHPGQAPRTAALLAELKIGT
jgi:rSAM/selenodomain-associated transferase 1